MNNCISIGSAPLTHFNFIGMDKNPKAIIPMIMHTTPNQFEICMEKFFFSENFSNNFFFWIFKKKVRKERKERVRMKRKIDEIKNPYMPHFKRRKIGHIKKRKMDRIKREKEIIKTMKDELDTAKDNLGREILKDLQSNTLRAYDNTIPVVQNQVEKNLYMSIILMGKMVELILDKSILSKETVLECIKRNEHLFF